MDKVSNNKDIPSKEMLLLWEVFLATDDPPQPDWKRVAAKLLKEVLRLRSMQKGKKK